MKPSTIKTTATLFSFLLVLMSFSLIGQTITWTGSVNNLWNEPGNWDLGHVPGFNEDVEFDPGSHTVVINRNATCRSLSNPNGASVTINGGSAIYLFVYAGIDLTQINWNFQGHTKFEIVDGSTHQILSAGQSFNGPVYFEGDGARWIIIDDFVCTKSMHLISGTLELENIPNGLNCDVDRFVSNNSNTRKLELNHAAFNVNGSYYNGRLFSWDVNVGSGLIVENNALLVFTPGFDRSYINIQGSSDENDFRSNGVNYGQDVEVVFSGGRGIITGSNNHFEKIVYHTNGRFKGGTNTIGILDLDAGHYRFDRNTDLVIDLINTNTSAPVSCQAQRIMFIGQDNLGGASTPQIEHTTPSHTLSHVTVNGVNAVGSLIDVNHLINIDNSPGWNPLSSPNPSTLKWTGASGNDWSDPGNWVPHCLPNARTHVVFDGNFYVQGEVEVDISNAACADMTWLNSSSAPTPPKPEISSTNGNIHNNLSIYGSIELENTLDMIWKFEGTTNFSAASGSHTVDIDNQKFDGLTVFDGKAGTWTLLSPFYSFEDLYVMAGTLNTNAKNVDVKKFRSDIVNQRSIDITNSVITCSNGWDIYRDHAFGGGPDPFMSLTTTGSTIKITGAHFQSTHDHGNTYNHLEFTDVSATQNLYGSDNTFNGNVTFLGSGRITKANTILGTLTFSAAKAYHISDNQDFNSVGDLNAIGNCRGYIKMTGGSFQNLATGNPNAEYCIIKNNQISPATPGLIADNSFGYLNTSGWTINTPPKQALFFKATTSNRWNDGNNWYTDPAFQNHASPACPPHPLNDVYFVDGSFQNFSTVEVDVTNAYCLSMYWNGGQIAGQSYIQPVVSGTILTNQTNGRLNVFGNLELLPIGSGPAQMTWDYDGLLRMEGQESGAACSNNVYKLKTEDQEINKSIYFDGCDQSSWTLQSQLKTTTGFNGIYLQRGMLNTNGETVTAGHFRSSGNQLCTLNLGTSTMNLESSTNANGKSEAWRTIDNNNFLLIAGASTIDFKNTSSGGRVEFVSQSHSFNNVYFSDGAYGSIQGNDKTFNRLEFDGNGDIYSSHKIQIELVLTENNVYEFEEGETQEIIGTLTASGSNSGWVFIRSMTPTVQSNFSKPSGKVCLDYAYIRDNKAGGGALFFDGPNFNNVKNNTGWSFTGCDSIDTLYGCVLDSMKFTSPLTGSSYTWNFGDSTGSSTLANPKYAYDSVGTYIASVSVNLGSTNDIRYFHVVIDSTCCEASITKARNLTCNGDSTGELTGLAFNGYSPYTYLWSNGVTTSTNNGLLAGTYSLVITDSVGCSDTIDTALTEPAPLTLNTTINQHVSCFGGNDGDASANASGGTPPYTYTWSTPPPTSLATGVHFVTVTDDSACLRVDSVMITQPAPLGDSLVKNISACPPQSNGEAEIVGTGGTPPYSYQWCCGLGTQSAVTGLSAQTYTVTITDDNSCTTTASVTITNLPYVGFPMQGFANSEGEVTGISTDAQGNYYLTGWFETSIDIADQGSNSITLNSQGGTDIFIAKYSDCGLEWARSLGDVKDDEGTGIVASQNQNGVLYISGNIETVGGMHSFDTGSSYGILPINLPALHSGFAAQIDISTGETMWVKAFSEGQPSATRATGISIDRSNPSDHIQVTGQFNRTINTNQQAGIQTFDEMINPGSTNFDAALFTLDMSGVFEYITPVGGEGDDIANAVQVEFNGPSQSDYVFFTGQVNITSMNPIPIMQPAPPSTLLDISGNTGQNAFVARVTYNANIFATEDPGLAVYGSLSSGGNQSGVDVGLIDQTTAVVAFEHDGQSDMSVGTFAGSQTYSPVAGGEDIILSHVTVPSCPGPPCPSASIVTNWFINAPQFQFGGLNDQTFGGIELTGNGMANVVGFYNETDGIDYNINVFDVPVSGLGFSATNTNALASGHAGVVNDVDNDLSMPNPPLFSGGRFSDIISVPAPLMSNSYMTSGFDAYAAKYSGGGYAFKKDEDDDLKEGISDSEMRIYPNPTAGSVTIDFSSIRSGSVVVRDIFGKLLLSKQFTAQTKLDLDISSFSNGVFLLEVSSGSSLNHYRIIKE